MAGSDREQRWEEFARFQCPEGHVLQKTIGDRRRVQCGSCATTYTRDDLVDRKQTDRPAAGRWADDRQ
jgi:hypothetical protein